MAWLCAWGLRCRAGPAACKITDVVIAPGKGKTSSKTVPEVATDMTAFVTHFAVDQVSPCPLGWSNTGSSSATGNPSALGSGAAGRGAPARGAAAMTGSVSVSGTVGEAPGEEGFTAGDEQEIMTKPIKNIRRMKQKTGYTWLLPRSYSNFLNEMKRVNAMMAYDIQISANRSRCFIRIALLQLHPNWF